MWKNLISKLGSKNSRIVHVKAHTTRKGKAYEMNNWCDKNARVELRKLVGGPFMPLKHASLYVEKECKTKTTEATLV